MLESQWHLLFVVSIYYKALLLFTEYTFLWTVTASKCNNWSKLKSLGELLKEKQFRHILI